MTNVRCESCGMPAKVGPYCAFCVDERGVLRSFDERRDRVVQLMLSRNPALGQARAEELAGSYLRTMPASGRQEEGGA